MYLETLIGSINHKFIYLQRGELQQEQKSASKKPIAALIKIRFAFTDF